MFTSSLGFTFPHKDRSIPLPCSAAWNKVSIITFPAEVLSPINSPPGVKTVSPSLVPSMLFLLSWVRLATIVARSVAFKT